MFIRCWGARGSIPVSGQEYLKYGGSTSCIEIRTSDDKIIIIDAGSGIRKLGNLLLKEKRYEYYMIFTHAHWDHVLGFPFFRPIYVKDTHIEMFGCPFAQDSVKKIISRTMAPPNFPVKFSAIRAEMKYHGACERDFTIGSMKITPINLSHPNQGMGYKFIEDGKAFVYLTDNELSYKHKGGCDYDDYLEYARGANLLIHDAEFTEEEYKTTRGWGHTVYKDALKLALEAKVNQFGLFHHNQEHSDQKLEEKLDDCQRIIKEHQSNLRCFLVSEGMEITL